MSKFANDEEMTTDLVSLAVENALLDMGKPILKVVGVRLKEEHNLEFSDALDHPNELSKILKDLFGDAYDILIEKMEENLKKSNQDNKVDAFLEAMVLGK